MNKPVLPTPQDSDISNNDPLLSNNQNLKSRPSLLTVILITVLVSAISFGLLGYFFGKFSALKDEQIIPQLNDLDAIDTTETMSSEFPEDSQEVAILPDGWSYKSNGQCGVELAIPPKAEPYYYPENPNTVPTSVTDERGSFWDFPRGYVYPNMLSKFNNLGAEWKDATAMFAHESGAGGGYIAQAVVVSCIPNNGQINSNEQLLAALNSGLRNFNDSTDSAGMEADNYSIMSSNQTLRWGKEVIDLVISGDYFVNYAEPFAVEENYTMLFTPDFIYEIVVVGDTDNDFVKETGMEIFNNIRFID